MSLCEKYNIEMILDGCDSLGTKWKDKLLVEYSLAGVILSFHHII